MSGLAAQQPGDDQEIDVWWGSYAGRTMLPGFVICGVATAVIIGGGWYLWWKLDLPPLEVRYTTYAVVGLIWLNQLPRWLYCIVVINYRLTTRRLLVERAFLRQAFTSIELSRVDKVLVEQTAIQRCLDVGKLHLVGESGAAPLAVLNGIYQPQTIAETIRTLAQRARERPR
jgi:hypothetical protein